MGNKQLGIKERNIKLNAYAVDTKPNSSNLFLYSPKKKKKLPFLIRNKNLLDPFPLGFIKVCHLYYIKL